MRSYYYYILLLHKWASCCVHLKLGHWLHALLKVCSDRDDIPCFQSCTYHAVKTQHCPSVPKVHFWYIWSPSQNVLIRWTLLHSHTPPKHSTRVDLWVTYRPAASAQAIHRIMTGRDSFSPSSEIWFMRLRMQLTHLNIHNNAIREL